MPETKSKDISRPEITMHLQNLMKTWLQIMSFNGETLLLSPPMIWQYLNLNFPRYAII